jgi:hypothetical protein
MSNGDDGSNWSAVIARCLAYLCLKNSKYADAQLLEQAKFLARLGLPARDRADVLGSSPDSLRVLSRLATKKRGKKSNAKPRRR